MISLYKCYIFSFWQSSVWKLTAIMVMNYPRTMVLNCDSDMCWWPGWHYSNWQAPNTLLPSRSRRLCNFSSSFPSRRSQCGYHEPQKQRKRAASDAHRINSARPRQISFHKGQKHLSKRSSTPEWKPKGTVRIQQAASLSCGLHSGLPASPLSTSGLALVFSQQPEMLQTNQLPHAPWEILVIPRAPGPAALWLHVTASPELPLPQPPQKVPL